MQDFLEKETKTKGGKPRPRMSARLPALDSLFMISYFVEEYLPNLQGIPDGYTHKVSVNSKIYSFTTSLT